MNSYKVFISKSVYKKLEKLPVQIEQKLLDCILSLQHNPRPQGYKKLKDRNGYRIRSGDYRIIYQIKDRELLILILDIGHRRDIYQ